MSNSIELTRKIYDEALGWYKTAESKAQILLGFVGTFTGILTTLILAKPVDVGSILAQLDASVIVAISFAFAAMLFGVYACYMALKSRLPKKEFIEPVPNGLYPDDKIMFFGFHAFHDPGKLADTLANIRDDKDEINVYAHQIVKLSRFVLKKHNWMNRGFVSICISIVFLLLTTVLYLVKLNGGT